MNFHGKYNLQIKRVVSLFWPHCYRVRLMLYTLQTQTDCGSVIAIMLWMLLWASRTVVGVNTVFAWGCLPCQSNQEMQFNRRKFFNKRCLSRARVFCGMRIAECGKLSRGNLRKIKCGTFRKVPLIAFPHSAAEKFGIFASFTVELSFDDLIWLLYSRVF